MLTNWQFNILFFVGVGGAVILLLGPEIGLDINQNPTAITGVGAILTYILTQKKSFTKKEDRRTRGNSKVKDEDSDNDEEEP